MTIRTLVFALTLAGLAGCMAPEVSLKKQAQEHLERVEGILIIPQNNLEVTVKETQPGNTGALGALIAAAVDSVRQSKAEKDAAPMFEALRDYDFRLVIQDAVSDALRKLTYIDIDTPLQLESIESRSVRRIAYDESQASAVLFIIVRYRLESGNLIVTAKAEIFPKKESLKQFQSNPDETNPFDDGNAIYRKKFTFTHQAAEPSTVREVLSEAASSLAQQIASDLDHGV